MKGTIKKLVLDRGFGFIKPAGGGPDVFFHCSALEDKSMFEDLEDGQAVTYDAAVGKDNKPKAENVIPG
jgi:CspA family cold shock protein